MVKTIDNSADVLDSRDIIARIEELEDERADLTDRMEEEDVAAELSQWDADNGDELKALKKLAENGEGSADWTHGETLIRESYFEDYARELAEDIGAVKADATWPCQYIDWEAAADALKQDYTECDFDGVTYLIRA